MRRLLGILVLRSPSWSSRGGWLVGGFVDVKCTAGAVDCLAKERVQRVLFLARCLDLSLLYGIPPLAFEYGASTKTPYITNSSN